MNRTALLLLGNVDAERKWRDLFLVAVPWFLGDVLTKGLALAWIAQRELRFFGGNVQLYLSINESLFGSGQHPDRLGITHAMVVGAALMQALLAGAGFVFGRAEWTVIRKLTLMGLVLIVGPGLGLLLGSLFHAEPHRLVEHLARACGSLAVLFLALRLTRSRYLGLALALGISGTLGNAANGFYYPRGIIDFIYVPRLGHYIGVFNLADVALELAKGLVLLSPLALICFRPLARRSEAWRCRLEYVNPPGPPTGTVSS